MKKSKFTCHRCQKEFSAKSPKYCGPCRPEMTGRNFVRELVRARDKNTCLNCHKVWQKGKRKFDVILPDQVIGKKYIKINLLPKLETWCHACNYTRKAVREKLSSGGDGLTPIYSKMDRAESESLEALVKLAELQKLIADKPDMVIVPDGDSYKAVKRKIN